MRGVVAYTTTRCMPPAGGMYCLPHARVHRAQLSFFLGESTNAQFSRRTKQSWAAFSLFFFERFWAGKSITHVCVQCDNMVDSPLLDFVETAQNQGATYGA